MTTQRTTDTPMDTRDLQAAQDGRTTEPTVETTPAPASEPAPGPDLGPDAAPQLAPESRPSIRAAGEARPAGDANTPLFDQAEGEQLQERWRTIQTEFVDEPRAAVEKADALVAQVLKQLTDSFARERQALEDRWAGSGNEADVSTEDLRQAIRRYRSFFDRLLNI